jgi:hypothetical protein
MVRSIPWLAGLVRFEAVASLVYLFALGCGANDRVAPQESGLTTTQAAAAAPASNSDSPPHIADSGPIILPASWTACASDADCVIVALGCCSKAAALRSRAQDVIRAIGASSRRECPVKAACGAGPSGNDDGEPAVCAAGACQLPTP